MKFPVFNCDLKCSEATDAVQFVPYGKSSGGICFRGTAVRDSGLLVCWSVGLLVCWSVGLLVCWSVGVLLCWSAGVLVCWYAGLLVCWSAVLQSGLFDI
jgi:hypothetical protein